MTRCLPVAGQIRNSEGGEDDQRLNSILGFIVNKSAIFEPKFMTSGGAVGGLVERRSIQASSSYWDEEREDLREGRALSLKLSSARWVTQCV